MRKSLDLHRADLIQLWIGDAFQLSYYRAWCPTSTLYSRSTQIIAAATVTQQKRNYRAEYDPLISESLKCKNASNTEKLLQAKSFTASPTLTALHHIIWNGSFLFWKPQFHSLFVWGLVPPQKSTPSAYLCSGSSLRCLCLSLSTAQRNTDEVSRRGRSVDLGSLMKVSNLVKQPI